MVKADQHKDRNQTLGSALTLAFALGLASCKQAAAESRFADDYNCPEATAEHVSGSTYHVTGCGNEATYTCLKEAAGWGNQSDMSRVTCIREATDDTPRHYEAQPPAPPPAQPRKGSVARLVDEKSGARGVSAEVPLLQAGAGGPLLRLRTKPGDDPNQIWAIIIGSTRQLTGSRCNAFALIVNGATLTATAPKQDTQGAVALVGASYAAAALAPIAQKNPTLQVRTCGATFAVPEDELATVQKFLSIRDELAQPPATAPSAPTPQPAPAAPAPPAAPTFP